MLTSMDEAGLRLVSEAAELRMVDPRDRPAVQAAARDADAIITRTAGKIDAEVLDWAPRLRVVGRHGVGFDHIDVPAATSRGIQVVYTPGANTQDVVEHAVAMMIALSKHFPILTRELEAGNYAARTSMKGREIQGRTLGVIGFGRIGKRLGEVCRLGFGMRVLYHDIVQAPEEAELRAGAIRVSPEELLRESDYVSLHVPLDASTHRMMDRAALSRVKKGCILLNTCRGPVVDEEAVADALDARLLWGYGADVFDVEPPPADHPLIGRRDVLLTPHSAAQTEEGLRNTPTMVALDVLNVLAGRRPDNPVNEPIDIERIRAEIGKPPLYRRESTKLASGPGEDVPQGGSSRANPFDDD